MYNIGYPEDMLVKGKSKQVLLKRVVTIKAVVTEQFKRFLSAEIEQAIKKNEIEIQKLDSKANDYLKEMEKSGETQETVSFKRQLSMEKQRYVNLGMDLQAKLEEAKNLPIGSHFIQGTVDGFVWVKEGDNLYRELGALEIIIRDGQIIRIEYLGEGPI